MGKPTGFLEIGRQKQPARPVAERLRDWREVYLPYEPAALQDQASRCMDCGIPFCHQGCPLGNLIPSWNDLVYRDRWQAASERLHATNNFPEFTGRLCPAPCEASCVLSIGDAPVTIKGTETAIVDRAFDEAWVVARPPAWRTGRHVAVVGSGPAGLAAADQLNRAGHGVTVFERADRIGGLLRYGIPEFKLEKRLLDRRLALMRAEGIVFRTGCNVGIDITADDLLSDFDATVLAGGSTRPRDLHVPGRELRGIHFAMDYLTPQNRRCEGDELPADENITAQGKHVVIIGGGDTGADCLGTVLRQGVARPREKHGTEDQHAQVGADGPRDGRSPKPAVYAVRPEHGDERVGVKLVVAVVVFDEERESRRTLFPEGRASISMPVFSGSSGSVRRSRPDPPGNSVAIRASKWRSVSS